MSNIISLKGLTEAAENAAVVCFASVLGVWWLKGVASKVTDRVRPKRQLRLRATGTLTGGQDASLSAK